MVIENFEKKYYLKSKNKELLEFKYSVENSKDGKINYFFITNINYENKDLFPLNLKLNSIGLEKWLKVRKAPKNRAFIDKLFEKISLDTTNIMNYIDVSFGLSLNDTYWILPKDKKDYKWEEYNLYQNDFSEILANIAFTGYGERITGVATSPELTTYGVLKKCWHKEDGEIFLYKGNKGETLKYANGGKETYSEFYSSQIAKIYFNNLKTKNKLFNIDYELKEFHNQVVSSCKLFTTEDKGYVSLMAVLESKEVENISLNIETIPHIKSIYGKENFEDLMIFDAIIGNTDRHLGNFGMLIDNDTGNLLEPAPVFDNGLCFLNRMTLDEIKDKNYLNKFINRETNAFNQTFEDVIKLYIADRHLESLEQLKNFKLEKDKNFNLDDEWLVAFESSIRENTKNFLEIYREKKSEEELNKSIKELAETKNLDLIDKIGIDLINNTVKKRILSCQNDNIMLTQEFLFSLKEALEIQELLNKNGLTKFETEIFYEIIDEFLEFKNNKDIKAVSDYLKKNDFPINYIKHFDEKFKLKF